MDNGKSRNIHRTIRGLYNLISRNIKLIKMNDRDTFTINRMNSAIFKIKPLTTTNYIWYVFIIISKRKKYTILMLLTLVETTCSQFCSFKTQTVRTLTTIMKFKRMAHSIPHAKWVKTPHGRSNVLSKLLNLISYRIHIFTLSLKLPDV